MISSALLAACASAIVIVASATAIAAPTRIAIANAADNSALAHRLEVELTALGFVAVDVDPWLDGASPDVVGNALATQRVLAAIRIDNDAADIWVMDPATRRPVLREVIRGESSGAREDVTIALRAAERVRAEIVVARRGKSPPQTQDIEKHLVAAPPQSAESENHRPFTFELGVGTSMSPGGLDASTTVMAGGAFWPMSRLGLSAFVGISPSPSVLTGREGTIEVRTGLLGGGIVWAIVPRAAPFGVKIEAGLSACWLSMDGFANAPYISGSDVIFTAAPYVRPRMTLRLTKSVGLQFGALVGAAIREPIIAFAGRPVASWGRPLVIAFAGVEVAP